MGIKINLTGMARGNGSKSCLESWGLTIHLLRKQQTWHP
jgi:hypothetical protein